MSLYISRIAAFVATGLLITGCGQMAEQATESLIEGSTGADVELKDDGMTITDGDGSITIESDGDTVTLTDESGTSTFQSGEGAELPASYPDNLPTPPGAVLITVTETPEGNLLMWESDRLTSEDFDTYIADIQGAGFVLDGEVIVVDSGDEINRIVTFTGSGKTIMLTALGSSDFGQLSLIITETP